MQSKRTYKDCISIKVSAGLEAEAGSDLPEADNLARGWPQEATGKPEAQRAPVLEVDLPEAAVSLGHPHIQIIWAELRLSALARRHFRGGVEDKLVIDGGCVAEAGPGSSWPWETGVILIYPHPLPAWGDGPGQSACGVIRVAVELACNVSNVSWYNCFMALWDNGGGYWDILCISVIP